MQFNCPECRAIASRSLAVVADCFAVCDNCGIFWSIDRRLVEPTRGDEARCNLDLLSNLRRVKRNDQT